MVDLAFLCGLGRYSSGQRELTVNQLAYGLRGFESHPAHHYPKTGSPEVSVITLDFGDVLRIPDWHTQLAQLIKYMWSGNGGICYFPYQPMATGEYWLSVALPEWESGDVRPAFYIEGDGRIKAYAAIVRKNGYVELGRFNSYGDNPRGIMLELTARLVSEVDDDVSIVCEATQAHTSSQWIASRLGLRFAGYGFLSYIRGVPWDILYFDNRVDLGDFVSSKPGLVSNLLGIERFADENHIKRLREAALVISIEKTSGFPPQKFHIYDKFLPHFQSILAMTIDPRA